MVGASVVVVVVEVVVVVVVGDVVGAVVVLGASEVDVVASSVDPATSTSASGSWEASDSTTASTGASVAEVSSAAIWVSSAPVVSATMMPAAINPRKRTTPTAFADMELSTSSSNARTEACNANRADQNRQLVDNNTQVDPTLGRGLGVGLAVMLDDLGDNKAEKFLAEDRIEPSFLSQRTQSCDLGGLAIGVRWGKACLGLVLANTLRDLETFGQEMHQGSIDIVDAVATFCEYGIVIHKRIVAACSSTEEPVVGRAAVAAIAWP